MLLGVSKGRTFAAIYSSGDGRLWTLGQPMFQGRLNKRRVPTKISGIGQNWEIAPGIDS